MWTYSSSANADELLVVDWWNEIVSTYVNNPDPWLIWMWINVRWNDSWESSLLHFWASYVPQWFATHRSVDYKINNWYANDLDWVYNLWDSASRDKQNWFIR